MFVLIVDDHEIVRDGLSAVLDGVAEVTGVIHAEGGAAMLRATGEDQRIDVIFLDLKLHDGDGLALLDAVHRQRPDIAMMIFSSSESPDDVRKALALGARGYLPKTASAATIRAALALVAAGQIYVPPLMAATSDSSAPPGLSSLTSRQVEVLKLIADDLPNATIAHRLAISEKTVKSHITTIFKALRVISRAQASRVARDSGLA